MGFLQQIMPALEAKARADKAARVLAQAENLYESPYKGDPSLDYLYYGQMGPMTERQAAYLDAAIARQRAKAEGRIPVLDDFMEWLGSSGKPQPKTPSLLDRLIQMDRIGPKK